MPKVCYIKKSFGPDKEAAIAHANRIIDEYRKQGFMLTVRQIYYVFVSRDLFPDDRTWQWTGRRWERDPDGTKNAEPNYQWLIIVLNEARLAGRIDWTAIEDRTRNVRLPPAWNDPADIIRSAANSYAIDKWLGQKYRPEVWIEKDALVGVIEGVCNDLNIPYYSCRGYVSQSEMWTHAQRFKTDYNRTKRMPVLIHLGDHDPSGIDMTRDIGGRIALFWYGEVGHEFPVTRIALNMAQVRRYNPPPNPAKLTDSRCRAYMGEYGDESWELDALEPAVIANLINTEVKQWRDEDIWNDKLAEEEEGRQRLLDLADQEDRHGKDEEE